MMFLIAMIAVAVLGVAAVVATGSLDRMQPVVRDHVEPVLDDACLLYTSPSPRDS